MYKERLLARPELSFFLLGPRGTGKSLWLRRCLPDAHWIDLLSEETYQRLLRSPEHLAAELRALAPGSWVVVDEVQRLPWILNEVHRFLEQTDLRFVLCGSSARKLHRAGVNLLAGRALHRSMHPFVPEELGEDFDLDAALRVGLLPIVWDSPEPGETLRAYARLYLREEIQAEALVRNLAGFARFLPVAATMHGQVLNVSNLARDAGVARTTVHGYLEILEQTMLCFRVPGFEAKLRVRERRLPKWYWCDPGLVRAMRGAGELSSEQQGVLFEGLVAQTLRATLAYRGAEEELYYWSSTASRGVEVDFLLRRGDRFTAIEVKTGTSFQQRWCRGLRVLGEMEGVEGRWIVVPRGPILETEDGIRVVPFDHFAARLAAGEL